MQTLYHIVDDRRNGYTTTDADRAERLSRAGLTVTAEVNRYE